MNNINSYKVLYNKYKDRTTHSLIKLTKELTEQARVNKWDLPLCVQVIQDILKEREVCITLDNKA